MRCIKIVLKIEVGKYMDSAYNSKDEWKQIIDLR